MQFQITRLRRKAGAESQTRLRVFLLFLFIVGATWNALGEIHIRRD